VQITDSIKSLAPLPSPDMAVTSAPEAASGGLFKNVMDTINPLQQLPVISNIYRAETGNSISGASRILGGLLFGGIPGAVFGAVNALFATETGKDAGESVMAAIKSPNEENNMEEAALGGSANDNLTDAISGIDIKGNAINAYLQAGYVSPPANINAVI